MEKHFERSAAQFRVSVNERNLTVWLQGAEEESGGEEEYKQVGTNEGR